MSLIDLTQQAEAVLKDVSDHPDFQSLEYSPDVTIGDTRQAIHELLVALFIPTPTSNPLDALIDSVYLPFKAEEEVKAQRKLAEEEAQKAESIQLFKALLDPIISPELQAMLGIEFNATPAPTPSAYLVNVQFDYVNDVRFYICRRKVNGKPTWQLSYSNNGSIGESFDLNDHELKDQLLLSLGKIRAL
jgi:hypothetical protein